MDARMYTARKSSPALLSSLTPSRNTLVQRKCACGETSGASKQSHTLRQSRFDHDFSHIPVASKEREAESSTNLAVNLPGDVHEQEADGVADQITQKNHSSIHMRGYATHQSGPFTAPPIVHEVLRSSSQPLDTSTRAFMEARFAHDFSRVRIHTDPRASESARALHARAYTVNSDVVFRAGQYAPETTMGKRLLAHELTHVVQQAGSAQQPQVQSPIGWLQRADDDDNGSSEDKSRQSKPKDAPRGTVPIDQSGLSKDEVHKIKDGIGAGPKDWVGISPEGHVIAGDHEGNAEDHGPASSYYEEIPDAENRAREATPNWVWQLLIEAGVLVLFIACFATGVCELAAIAAAVGVAAVLIIGILKGIGTTNGGSGGATASNDQDSSPQEEAA